MAKKTTSEELEKKVKELEKETLEQRQLVRHLRTFETAVESSINAIGITDLEGKLTYVNDSCVKMWGFNSKDEMLGRFLPEFWEGDGVFRTIKELREKNVDSGEGVGKRKDGSLFFVQFSASMFKDEAGNPSFMFGSFFDITERKQAEKVLRESEERLAAFMDSATDGFVLFDSELNYLKMNKAGQEITGVDRKEIMGKNALDVIPDFKETGRYDKFKKVMKTGVPLIIHDLLPHPKFGGKHLNVKVFKVGDGLGVIFTDITKRRQAEEALRESEERYRRLVETMTDGLGIQDENGLITYVNNKFCQMLGYQPDDFIGKTVSDFLDEKNKRILKEQIPDRRKGKTKPYELVWERKDGTKLPTMMSPQSIFDEKKQFKGSFAVITDISDIKAAEDALKKAHDELEQRVEERTAELKIKSKSLEELNTAMKVLLEKRAEDKIKLEDSVMTNTKDLIGPLIGNLKETKLNHHQKMILSIIESNLEEITSKFTRKLSLEQFNLTPTELKIANYIKHGTTTKEIARLMNSSPRTIETHRKNIREKIGLKQARKNLRSYLLSLH